MSLAGVAFMALLWEASIVLWSIGFMELGIGDNDPKDFGIVLLSAGFMETISLIFIIAAKDVFGAVAAAGFIMLLWVLGAHLMLKSNGKLLNHSVWFTGIYFLLAGFFTIDHKLYSLTILFWLLVIVTWTISLRNYGEGKGWGKFFGVIAGISSFLTAILLFAMAFAGAIGHPLP